MLKRKKEITMGLIEADLEVDLNQFQRNLEAEMKKDLQHQNQLIEKIIIINYLKYFTTPMMN